MVMTNNMNNKTTQGRKKIEIKKIEQTPNLHVTFSKRRAGLFKKASELCILSGAEVAIIVKSPGDRVFAFGHPNADSIIDRYLTGNRPNSDIEITNLPSMHEFNQHYSEVSKDLEMEKLKKVAIEESKVVNNGGFWWDQPVDEIGFGELENYMAALEELKKKVAIRADELVAMKASALSLDPLSSSVFTVDPTVGFADHLLNQTVVDYRAATTTPSSVPHGFGFGRGHF